jgi:hypothetical protein
VTQIPGTLSKNSHSAVRKRDAHRDTRVRQRPTGQAFRWCYGSDILEPMQIRDLTPADFPAVVELWKQAGLTRPWNPPETDLQRALDGATSFYDHLGYEDADVHVRSKWLNQ